MILDDLDVDCPDGSQPKNWFPDVDGDSYGLFGSQGYECYQSCDEPTDEEKEDEEKGITYVDNAEDCVDDPDEYGAQIYPRNDEICNDGIDNDCSGEEDDNAIDAPTWYPDVDDDGYGDMSDPGTVGCTPPETADYDYEQNNEDCDDSDPDIHPETVWYADNDNDGYGDPDNLYTGCAPPTGYILTDHTDCNDSSTLAHPGLTEVCTDDLDNDCNGEVNRTIDAGGSGIICLSTVGTTNNGIKLNGEGYANRFGLSLSSAGDVDNDGFDDFLIGAPGWNGDNVGRAYLVYGGSTLVSSVSDISSLADATFSGEASGDVAGVCVAPVGDASGDGIDDFMIGAPYHAAPAGSGAAYLVRGNTSRFSGFLDLGSISSSDGKKFVGVVTSTSTGAQDGYQGAGSTLDRLEEAVGENQLLIGVPNTSYIETREGGVYVASGIGNGEVSLGRDEVSSSGTVTALVMGEAGNDYAGDSITAGDFNGDGVGDFVMGAWANDDGGGNAGAAYLFYGPVTGVLSASDADITFLGGAGYWVGGYALAAGDADGDDLTDLLVTAYGINGAYLFMGSNLSYLPNSVDVSTYPYADATFIGDSGSAFRAVRFAGDVDGDGNQDLIVGAAQNDEGGEGAGAAYLIYGPFSGTINLSDVGNTVRGVKFIGEYPQQQVAISVAGAGDVNDDGYNDLLIGAEGDVTNGIGAGAAYLIPGGASL